MKIFVATPRPPPAYPENGYAEIATLEACRGAAVGLEGGMELTAARSQLHRSFARMNSLYGGEVFNEWAVITARGSTATIAAYEGPRAEQFRTRFLADVQVLQAELTGRALAVGEFVFALTAEGTAFDACLRAGDASYLLLNHTERTMDEIRQAPAWRDAQRAFAELSEAFRLDPLT